MKINDKYENGFAHPPVFVILLLMAALFFLASCGDTMSEDKPALKETDRSVEEIKDNSMEFTGKIAQATCLECHPAAKEAKSDIDFEKVKKAGMMRGKNMDVPKEERKGSKESK